MKLMRDDYNCFSVCFHIAKNREKLCCFLRSQNGCRLVKDKNISASVKNLYNFNRLLFGNRHFMNFFVRVNIKAVFFSDFGNFLRRLFDIVTALFIESENNILGCGKYIYKLKMLMYHTDFIVECVPRRTDNGFLSVYENLTLVRIINTRDHIHKRGFTASVLAE